MIDHNSISGNADAICRSEYKLSPNIFISDCYPRPDNVGPEIVCNCCTKCCVDTDFNCNNNEVDNWIANLDPIYEYKYQRQGAASASVGAGDGSDISDNTIYRFDNIEGGNNEGTTIGGAGGSGRGDLVP